MRAFEIQQFGGLTAVEREEPQPGPGEVKVRLRAVSLNYRDLLMMRGQYNPRQKLPLIPCSDGAGVVVETGPGVRRVRAGDRVVPIFAQGWLAGRESHDKLKSSLGGPLDGTLAELMVVPEEGVVPIPPYLSVEEACTLPCAAVTAWNALTGKATRRAGDTVLTLGTGGVSVFVLQIARLLGVRAIVTSSSDDKLARARALGAWQGINYLSRADWGQAALELTGGLGVDQVIELGGAATLAQSLRAVRPGGEISIIGVLAGAIADFNVTPVLMRGLRLQGVLVGSREHFEELLRAMAAHEMHPVIDRTFPFSEAPQAFDYLAAGRHFGKVVLYFD